MNSHIFSISFKKKIVVSAKIIRWKKCQIKLHRRPRKEIRISAQLWFQAVVYSWLKWNDDLLVRWGYKFPPHISVAKACGSPCMVKHVILKDLVAFKYRENSSEFHIDYSRHWRGNFELISGQQKICFCRS